MNCKFITYIKYKILVCKLIVPGGSDFWCVSMVARPQPLREKGNWKAQIRRWTQEYFQVTEHPLGVQLNQTFRNGQRMAAVNIPIVQAVLKNWVSVQQGHQETHNSKREKYKRPCIQGYRLCSSWLDASPVAVLWAYTCYISSQLQSGRCQLGDVSLVWLDHKWAFLLQETFNLGEYLFSRRHQPYVATQKWHQKIMLMSWSGWVRPHIKKSREVLVGFIKDSDATWGG